MAMGREQDRAAPEIGTSPSCRARRNRRGGFSDSGMGCAWQTRVDRPPVTTLAAAGRRPPDRRDDALTMERYRRREGQASNCACWASRRDVERQGRLKSSSRKHGLRTQSYRPSDPSCRILLLPLRLSESPGRTSSSLPLSTFLRGTSADVFPRDSTVEILRRA